MGAVTTLGRSPLALGLLILLASTRSAPVEGHAIIMESSPNADEVVKEPPSGLTLRFNSRIVHALSRAVLYGPDGQKLPIPTTTRSADRIAPDRLIVPLPPLAPGKYRVEWRVLAEDGHVTEGGFFFHHGTPH